MSKLGVVTEIHKPARKNYLRRSVTLKGINDLWQADLVEMIPYSKVNNGFNYILTVIDGLSKYGYAEPIRRKNTTDVVNAFKKILLESNVSPKNLQTDQGKEFYNKEFSKLMKSNNINHYSTFSNLKASIVERWNRTLKNLMWREFSLQGTYKWLKLLPKIVRKYNDSKHRTIRMAPNEVTEKCETELLRRVNNFKKKYSIKKSKLQVGDSVRISKEKGIFEKGYQPNWSTEIFKIRNVQPTIPRTFELEDFNKEPVLGSFYIEELQKTKYPDVYLVEKILKRKKDQVYVKWLGFPKPTWIKKSDVLL